MTSLLRTVYYTLPPSVRILARKIYYFPSIFTHNKEDLLPPKALIYTGRGDYKSQGEFWFEFFKTNAGLLPEFNFLDIGSGVGRVAVPMVNYLKGDYEGFDVVKQGVDWCESKITSKYPNFKFTYVDILNDLYNSSKKKAENYIFPYPDNKFQVACSISVFTHMTDIEVKNYLKQTARVLSQNGKLVATFFILDDKYDPETKGSFRFEFPEGECFLMDKHVKGANVAFDIRTIERYCNDAGLKIEKHFSGLWKEGKSDPNYFQDILILSKL